MILAKMRPVGPFKLTFISQIFATYKPKYGLDILIANSFATPTLRHETMTVLGLLSSPGNGLVIESECVRNFLWFLWF